MGSFAREAVKLGFTRMVDAACKSASERMGQNTAMTEHEKRGVEGMMCESLTFVAELVVTREASATQAGVHLVTNGINLAKLTPSQQVYCAALKSELALQSVKLAGIAAATYTGAVAGANGGLVAGGIGGTVVAGPAGTVPGAIAGGLVGAGGPLLLGSVEMYDTVATITDLAIDIHSQCGPLAMDAAAGAPRTSLP